MTEATARPANDEDDGSMTCARCGRTLRPRDAEAADGLALSESANLVHRNDAVCAAGEAEDRLETLDAMVELEKLGLWEIRIGDEEPVDDDGAPPEP